MVKKMTSRDMEEDDDELEDSDCLHFHDCWIEVSVLYRHTLSTDVLTRRSVYSRAAFISLSSSDCAALILFEGGVYSRKYGTLFSHC